MLVSLWYSTRLRTGQRLLGGGVRRLDLVGGKTTQEKGGKPRGQRIIENNQLPPSFGPFPRSSGSLQNSTFSFSQSQLPPHYNSFDNPLRPFTAPGPKRRAVVGEFKIGGGPYVPVGGANWAGRGRRVWRRGRWRRQSAAGV